MPTPTLEPQTESAETASLEPPSAAPAAPRTRPDERTKPKILPPHAVILHNDDINTMEFVVRTLRKVFGYGTAKSIKLMWQAHRAGRAVIWAGQKEHAEFKADQIRSCGADPIMRRRGAMPLRVSIEPLPA